MTIGRDDNLLMALKIENWPTFCDREGKIQIPTYHREFEGSTRFVNYETNDKNKRLPELYSSKEDCCGCSACAYVCPKKAIKMFPDVEGFLYPIIDANVCVGCGACLKVCPLKTL